MPASAGGRTIARVLGNPQPLAGASKPDTQSVTSASWLLMCLVNCAWPLFSTQGVLWWERRDWRLPGSEITRPADDEIPGGKREACQWRKASGAQAPQAGTRWQDNRTTDDRQDTFPTMIVETHGQQPVSAHNVIFVEERTANRAHSAGMAKKHIASKDDAPTGTREAARQLDILTVEEKGFIEQIGCGESLGQEQHSATAHPDHAGTRERQDQTKKTGVIFRRHCWLAFFVGHYQLGASCE